MDIFAQPSSAEFMKLLQPETENLTSGNQVKMENLFVEKGIKKYSRPFQNKMPESINKPLEKEPRVKVVVPKPEPRGQEVKIKNKLITSQLWTACQHLTSKINQNILDSMEEIFIGPTTRR